MLFILSILCFFLYKNKDPALQTKLWLQSDRTCRVFLKLYFSENYPLGTIMKKLQPEGYSSFLLYIAL